MRTSRHLLRSSNDSDVIPTLRCACGKLYSFQQSLRHHQKKCAVHLSSIAVPTTVQASDKRSVLQRLQDEMKELRERLITLEKKQEEYDKKQEEFEKEQKQMRAQIAMLLDKSNTKNTEVATTATLPVPTKRRKINKDLRQQIADKQENACGSCKLALTPYFQIDHTVGLQFGGTDEESNLMALCCECHAMKSIAENQCRKQIQEAIQTILTDKLGQRG
jgi:5-methylcytosine-specific restriction endonuclease McrA